MAFPTRYPDWATVDELSPEGAPNKAEVPEEFKLSGLKAYEPMPRAYFNDQMNLMGQWVRELKTQFDSVVVDSSSAILQQIFPVGAYWISDNTSTPNTLLGFGTWSRVSGKFLVGLDSTDTDFDGVGETGGSKTHNHNHTLSVPDHNHIITNNIYDTAETDTPDQLGGVDIITPSTTTSTEELDLTGVIISSTNLPPYKTTNIWVRTA